VQGLVTFRLGLEVRQLRVQPTLFILLFQNGFQALVEASVQLLVQLDDPLASNIAIFVDLERLLLLRIEHRFLEKVAFNKGLRRAKIWQFLLCRSIADGVRIFIELDIAESLLFFLNLGKFNIAL
jgi:hypothetical protein